MFQHPIQTAIQPVLFRHREVLFQQRVHGAFHEPLPMHSKLAARLQQPVHHQQPQHLLPTHRSPGLPAMRSRQNSLSPN